MSEAANVIVQSGRAGIELALFVVLPVMVVMLCIMRLLEAKGALDVMVRAVTPLLKPFGLPGLGVFAMVQVMFVSALAPVATLAIMDSDGAPRRHIAATLAMVLALPQANVSLPMAAVGLDLPVLLLVSLVCGLIGAAATYYLFARNLSDTNGHTVEAPAHAPAEGAKGVLEVINRAGAEAFRIAVGAIPILVLALVIVDGLAASGGLALLEGLLAPVFALLDLPASMIVPVITKFIGGGTAMLGVAVENLDKGLYSIEAFNGVAGFLVHPFDIPGIAILISSGPRVAAVLRPAIFGAVIAIALRTVAHVLLF